jgi:hypothetical protein
MPPKRKNIGKTSSAAKRMRNSRAEQQEQRRLDLQAVHDQQRLQAEEAQAFQHQRALDAQAAQERERIAKQVGKGSLNSGCMTVVTDFPEKYVIQHDCGSFADVCCHCKAFSWAKERSSLCCKNGKIQLPAVPPPPSKLMELYDVNKTFLEKVRSFNNAFALASMGCKQIRFPSGVSCFKVQGKIHHFIGSLLPSEGETPKFPRL